MVKRVTDQMDRANTLLLIAVAAIFFLAGCAGNSMPQQPTQIEPEAASGDQVAIEMPHIHGLAFSADGRQLVVPAHDGLRLFSDGDWQVPSVPAHDYMGFAPADDGFYSSGHPQPSSGLINPIGLVKSTDEGQTLIRLAFEGESDFHLMGVGYASHAIYVFNPVPNSKLSAGIHYSLDDGQSWQQSALAGIGGQPIQIAVHPTQASVVALATEAGLFLSDDYGGSFEPIGEAGPVTAAAFGANGEELLSGYQRLFVYDLSTGQIVERPAPSLAADDAVSTIAVNPARPEELALATYGRHIYWWPAGRSSWSKTCRRPTGSEGSCATSSWRPACSSTRSWSGWAWPR